MKRIQLTGKCAIVTGGGTGIGQAIALSLAEQGANLVLAGRRHEPLRGVASTMKVAGGQAKWLAADVTQEEDVEEIVATAMSAFATSETRSNPWSLSIRPIITSLSTRFLGQPRQVIWTFLRAIVCVLVTTREGKTWQWG